MTTVLPTPAPPKRPILPPLGYGSIRSITLMPVESTSCSVDWSVKSGASLWMGSNCAASIGPLHTHKRERQAITARNKCHTSTPRQTCSQWDRKTTSGRYLQLWF
eukprot:3637659-Pleurochrysis_carterae.AAC.1